MFLQSITEDDITSLLNHLPNKKFSSAFEKVLSSTTNDKTVKKVRLHNEELPKEDFLQVFEEEFHL